MKNKKRITVKVVIIMSILLISIKSIGQQSIKEEIPYIKPLFDFDYDKPLFDLNNSQLTNSCRFLRFYVLSGYIEGVEPVKGFINMDAIIDNEHSTVRSYWINSSIQDILTLGALKSGKVLLEVKDPSHYRYDSSKGAKLEWERKNTYCLEFLYPLSTTDFKEMQKEVCDIFGVTFKREKRLVDALVLTRTSKKDKIKSDNNGVGKYDMKGYFHNVPLDRMSDPLNEAEMPPFVNETGYKGNVDMDLKLQSWNDLFVLKKALQKYDLDINKEKREVEMFVITENGFKK